MKVRLGDRVSLPDAAVVVCNMTRVEIQQSSKILVQSVMVPILGITPTIDRVAILRGMDGGAIYVLAGIGEDWFSVAFRK